MSEVKYTLDDLRVLKEAIALGAVYVVYADRQVRYRSIAEMVQIKNMIEKELYPKEEITNVKFNYGSGR
jgi:hypothetical protein